MHGDPVAGPWSGRVGMSITRAMAWTSRLGGGYVLSAQDSQPLSQTRRHPGRSTQIAGSEPQTQPTSRHSPATRGGQAGGWAGSPGLLAPTLTWRLCSPSRQAEIKATGVSLVGLALGWDPPPWALLPTAPLDSNTCQALL